MPTLPSPEQTGSRSGQLRISPWAQEVGRPCGYEGHQAGLQLHMPSKHIVFTQFWGSAGRGRTHGNSGGPTASPAIPTLPLGYSTLVITLLLKSLRGSPVLLGQIQIPAWGAQGLPPTLSALYLIPPPLTQKLWLPVFLPFLKWTFLVPASGPLLKVLTAPGMLFPWLLVTWLLVFLLLSATMLPPQGILP